MRLSIVTDTYPPDVNGVANTLHRLQAKLRRRGHEVETIVPGDLLAAALGHGSIARDAASASLRLAALPLPGYKGLRFGLPSRGALVKHWRKHRPDIIYVATESLLGLSAVGAAAAVGACVVSGYHTNFDHYMRDYQFAMLEEFACLYLRTLHNRTLATFAPSPDAIARLRTMGFNNLRLLGRGVDAVLFNPAKRSAQLRATWGAGERDTVALYVGRLAPEKNLPLAMSAFDAMASGLVTVAYDSAAARLHLRHQVNGLTAGVDDEPAFLAACIHALDHTRWREWRDEARHTASGLSWSSVVTRFENDLQRFRTPDLDRLWKVLEVIPRCRMAGWHAGDSRYRG